MDTKPGDFPGEPDGGVELFQERSFQTIQLLRPFLEGSADAGRARHTAYQGELFLLDSTFSVRETSPGAQGKKRRHWAGSLLVMEI